jgi:hypothetical protein
MKQYIARENQNKAIILEKGLKDCDADVNLPLIRWMLSLSPAERLDVLQQWIRDALRFETVSPVLCDCPLIIDDRSGTEHAV